MSRVAPSDMRHAVCVALCLGWAVAGGCGWAVAGGWNVTVAGGYAVAGGWDVAVAGGWWLSGCCSRMFFVLGCFFGCMSHVATCDMRQCRIRHSALDNRKHPCWNHG